MCSSSFNKVQPLHLRMCDVRHVPKLTKTLISTGQLNDTRDTNTLGDSSLEDH